MKISVVILLFLLLSFAIGYSETKETENNETHNNATSIADRQIQDAFYSKLLNINSELGLQHLTVLSCYEKIMLHAKEEALEISYRGYIPYDVKLKRKETEEKKKIAEKTIKDLEKDKLDLRLEILKYFNGTMPDYLFNRWYDQEDEFGDFMDDYIKKLGNIR